MANFDKAKAEQNDEVFSNVDFKIKSDRVIYVINRCINKLEFLTHLPFLLDNDGEFLKQHLAADETHFILEVCKQYLTKKCDAKTTTDTEMSRILGDIKLVRPSMICRRVGKETSLSCLLNKKPFPETNFDPHISQVVDLITTNIKLKNALKTVANTTVDVSIVAFIEELKKLRDVAIQRLSVSEFEELKRERHLRRAYTSNIQMKSTIKELQDELQKQRNELGGQLNKKFDKLNKYTEKIKEVKRTFNYKMNDIVQESEKSMMMFTLSSEEKQTALATEAQNAVQFYSVAMEENLEEEKQLRSKRFKVQTQLSSWLAKYDNDIGERQAEYEALKKEYDDKKAEMSELQNRFDDQEEEYTVLMQEKEEEDEQRYKEMAYEFLTNHAAIRIQRCWRAYKERKLARRRHRKRKDKSGKSASKKEKTAKKHELAKEAAKALGRREDANVTLQGKFKEDLFEDVKVEGAFDKKDVTIDL